MLQHKQTAIRPNFCGSKCAHTLMPNVRKWTGQVHAWGGVCVYMRSMQHYQYTGILYMNECLCIPEVYAVYIYEFMCMINLASQMWMLFIHGRDLPMLYWHTQKISTFLDMQWPCMHHMCHFCHGLSNWQSSRNNHSDFPQVHQMLLWCPTW